MNEQTTSRVRLEARDGTERLVLAGVIDVQIAVDVHRAAVEAARSGLDVVIDAGDVEYLDVAALQVLLALRQALAAAGRAFHVEPISAPARDCCDRSGLRQALGVGG